MPFVSLEKSQDPLNHPCVIVNNRRGVRDLVRYILAQGHTRGEFIGTSLDLVISGER